MKEKYPTSRGTSVFIKKTISYRKFGEIKPKISKISPIYTRKKKSKIFPISLSKNS
jgi:hypothetical protein